MEQSGGAPDLIAIQKNELVFADCSETSPNKRRNMDYYHAAIQAHKFHVELMNSDFYYILQNIGEFDWGSSSLLYTPQEILDTGEAQCGLRIEKNIFDIHQIAATHKDPQMGWRGIRIEEFTESDIEIAEAA
jgi:hypothetical protein